MSDKQTERIDPENETWKRGDDPRAAAIALAEASMGSTGAGHHAGEAVTKMREAQEAEATKGEKKAASHKPAAPEAKSD